MRTRCYYLLFRQPSPRSIDWDNPTGGLMLKPERYVDEFPIGDFQLAAEVLKKRYHCGPHECVVIAEVFEKKEIRLARKLHLKWVADVREFRELMNAID
jgi:hypothetical protein